MQSSLFPPHKRYAYSNSAYQGKQGEVVVRDETSWEGVLYRDVAKSKQTKTIRLIPYYAWGNRGKSEMTVWMPAAY